MNLKMLVSHFEKKQTIRNINKKKLFHFQPPKIGVILDHKNKNKFSFYCNNFHFLQHKHLNVVVAVDDFWYRNAI